MFTGIIEEVGLIRSIQNSSIGARLEVGASKVLEACAVGDSIATNGVCLTVESFGSGSFKASVMPESLRKTGLGSLHIGSKVNLERAMAAGGRYGGHIVSGHVDAYLKVSSIIKEGIASLLTVEAPREILKYVALKGSVTLNGVSLTVAGLSGTGFTVSLIPHSLSVTNLGDLRAGDRVNVEVDMLARYVERLLLAGSSTGEGVGAASGGGLTLEFLKENGF